MMRKGVGVTYGAGRAVRKLCLVAGLMISFAGFAQADEKVTIAALGDSLTQGYGLPEADGFVPRLDAWLNAQGDVPVEIINAGVSGDTTAGGLARVGWTLSDDVDAVIVALGGNDVLRGIEPEVSRANLDAILSQIGARGLPVLLVGLPAPANYGADFKTEFDAIFPDLAEQHETLLYASFLGALSDDGNLAAARAFMQADGLHPNASGVLRIVEDIGPRVQELSAQALAAR